jgi:selenophosphate synthase
MTDKRLTVVESVPLIENKPRTPRGMLLAVPPEIASTIKATAAAAGVTIAEMEKLVAALVFARLTTEEVVALGEQQVQKRLDRLRGVGRPAGEVAP